MIIVDGIVALGRVSQMETNYSQKRQTRNLPSVHTPPNEEEGNQMYVIIILVRPLRSLLLPDLLLLRQHPEDHPSP